MGIKDPYIRNLTTRQFNELQGQRIREDSLKKLENHMIYLRIFASINEIPEYPKMPPTFPMSLDQNSIQNLPYRNYLVRHSIKQAENTLFECQQIPANRFIGYYSSKVGTQEKAMEKLVTLLKRD